ncbi:hypothetical protein MKW98_018708 [Papaver atlanticum]|uniref:Uncharacterized protein n=1 Tax=Papaver atlanticum TaxID=357466 RepID=A0AAD4T2L2_9MAGN|nr:hypothetical protein MKW98_018708 [Papaver atlanticum]
MWSRTVCKQKHAEEARGKLNGTTVGKQTVSLSWGCNPSNKQMRADPSSNELHLHVWGIFSISQPTSKLIAEVKMIKATFEWLHEMVKSWIWG